MKNDDAIIACMLVSELKHPRPEATVSKCFKCQRDIWIMRMNLATHLPLYCRYCAREKASAEAAKGEEIIVAPATEAVKKAGETN